MSEYDVEVGAFGAVIEEAQLPTPESRPPDTLEWMPGHIVHVYMMTEEAGDVEVFKYPVSGLPVLRELFEKVEEEAGLE